MKQEETKINRTQRGIVVSDKMDKTIVVSIARFVKHPKYLKYISMAKKYKAHDEKGEAHIGDEVEIKEVRPISKDKRFELVKIIKAKSK